MWAVRWAFLLWKWVVRRCLVVKVVCADCECPKHGRFSCELALILPAHAYLQINACSCCLQADRLLTHVPSMPVVLAEAGIQAAPLRWTLCTSGNNCYNSISECRMQMCLPLCKTKITHDINDINHRRKFRSPTSDNMDRWKAEQGRGREKRKIRRKKRKKKEDADAWKGRIVAKHCVFPMIWGSGAAGAEPAGQMRDEKLHAVVARSTFPSQNVQSTPVSDDFWQLRCWKSARRCGAKHIWKSKCTKHTRFGPLLAVEMLKKCTLLWREAHFEIKMYKTQQVRTTFGSWDV